MDIPKNECKNVRQKILEVIYKSKAGHIASSFSIVEILLVLYYKILKFDINDLKDRNRDRFILSKGHACVALYVILAELGIISADNLNSFCSNGSLLGSHPDKNKVKGIEASTGSLGHGLSIAVGIALAATIDGDNYRVFCLLGDGECNEGQVWEAISFASQNCLKNLIVIIDFNQYQASGATREILNLDNLAERFRSFSCLVIEVNGHDIEELSRVLNKSFHEEKPTVIIAHTVKGKGVSFMENDVSWHTRIPNREEYELALKELS